MIARIFLLVYDAFDRHRIVMWLVMLGTTVGLGALALRINLEEDVTKLFPDSTAGGAIVSKVFSSYKGKDRISVLFSQREDDSVTNGQSQLIGAAEDFTRALQPQLEAGTVDILSTESLGGAITRTIESIVDQLPVYADSAAYLPALRRLADDDRFADSILQSRLYALQTPIGFGLKNTLPYDPLGLAGTALKALGDLQLDVNYTIIQGHIFDAEGKVLILSLMPRSGIGETAHNDRLVTAIEAAQEHVQRAHPHVDVQYFGGSAISVYNARQIKHDVFLTAGIALGVIGLLILLTFRSFWVIPLTTAPVLYGIVFALAWMQATHDTVSAVSVGIGSVVLGIAISYSIHVITHFRFVHDRRSLVRELAYPLTVGSFTTIGAFLGLQFTSSAMLRDFGLFSALALIGTTLYCLLFLPHLLPKSLGDPSNNGILYRWITRVLAYRFDKNRILVGGIAVAFLAGLFLLNRVGFDSDMSKLGYIPPQMAQAEKRLHELLEQDGSVIPVVAASGDHDEAIVRYQRLHQKLDSLHGEGLILDYSDAANLLTTAVQRKECYRAWRHALSDSLWDVAAHRLSASAERVGFTAELFAPFQSHMRHSDSADVAINPLESLLGEWCTTSDSLTMCTAFMRVDPAMKDALYQHFSADDGLVVFDRGYFTNQWVSNVRNDFYLTLSISSLLIFAALLISYGRIELTLITFAPMAISWVIIVGMMALLDIQFNIVNIVLATFIFGLGDDFSIFIMEGLRQRYQAGREMLTAHKVAIFFSAFTAVVGLGVMIFAQHPAMHSIAAISFLGMAIVVLIAYSILPALFRGLIERPISKGCAPATCRGIVESLCIYTLFLVGTLILLVAAIVLLPLPASRRRRCYSWFLHHAVRRFLALCLGRRLIIDQSIRLGEESPIIVVANHQSLVDVLVLLSIAPRMTIMVKGWVWKAPILGWIARAAGFLPTSLGQEQLLCAMRERSREGFHVIIFPEGTRSYDGRIGRFHNGAFQFSRQLGLDIQPVLIHGTLDILPRQYVLRIERGEMHLRFLPRVPHSPVEASRSLREEGRALRDAMRLAQRTLLADYRNPRNPFLRRQLLAAYTYKGPVLEHYIRIKSRLEDYYSHLHALLPHDGLIVDLGCGYGAAGYMLHLLSPDRSILGIDYDEEKISIASHAYLRNEQCEFLCADLETFRPPQCQAALILDVLHYLPEQAQRNLLLRALDAIQPGGRLVVRDGDTGQTRRHRWTQFTEFMSTRLLRFNKAMCPLVYPSEGLLRAVAQQVGAGFSIEQSDRLTSNRYYIIDKR